MLNYLLFTTTQCPKCPAFKAFVAENVDFTGEILNEKTPNFMDNIKAYGVKNAPTMIILKNNQEVFRTDEVYQLEEFLKTL